MKRILACLFFPLLLFAEAGVLNSLGRWSMFAAGLPSLNVTALTASCGYLYVGTDNGLVRIAEANL